MFTVDSLEKMFICLECSHTTANVFPMEPIASTTGLIEGFNPFSADRLPIDWSMCGAWLENVEDNNLILVKISNLHWSKIPKQHATSQFGYMELNYSVVNNQGKFVKFPLLSKIKEKNLYITKTNCPSWCFRIEKAGADLIGYNTNICHHSLQIFRHLRCITAVFQSLPNFWQIKTRLEGTSSTITLLTDPTGVKEFWKLRDIPEGKRRREALLHWVSDHWRQTRNDPDVEGYVRTHLRGSTSLQFKDIAAEIIPSNLDLLREQKAIAHRKQLKDLKKDRRKRRLVYVHR